MIRHHKRNRDDIVDKLDGGGHLAEELTADTI